MNLQELKRQLEAQDIKADEAAIASKLETIGVSLDQITDEIQELVVQDLALAFRDEQNGSAIAPRKRSQKQAIADIRSEFAKHGIQYTDTQIKAALQSKNMDAIDVEASHVQLWAKEINSSYLTKAEQAIAPAQAPQQQQTPVSTQPVASAIHGTVKQLVVTHSQGEKDAIAALANYYSGTSNRIVEGVNQHLALVDFSSPLESLVQQQRDSWASTHNAIAEAIANVNAAAGHTNAA